ncbi:hypothetical protein HID58_063686, partial [Brassica napus]
NCPLVEITSSMVAAAFHTREIGEGSRLSSCTTSSLYVPSGISGSGSKTHQHLANIYSFFTSARDLTDFVSPGISPDDPAESTTFLEKSVELATNLRDPAFLLHPDIIQMTSLASSDSYLSSQHVM